MLYPPLPLPGQDLENTREKIHKWALYPCTFLCVFINQISIIYFRTPRKILHNLNVLLFRVSKIFGFFFFLANTWRNPYLGGNVPTFKPFLQKFVWNNGSGNFEYSSCFTHNSLCSIKYYFWVFLQLQRFFRNIFYQSQKHVIFKDPLFFFKLFWHTYSTKYKLTL